MMLSCGLLSLTRLYLVPSLTSSLRCCRVFQRGVVIGAGEPKTINYRALIDAASLSSSTGNENVPSAHNAAPAVVATGLAFDDDF
jgi:hypothetical protein